MAKKVYIVDLDARNEAAIRKINEVEGRVIKSSGRMEKAIGRIGPALVAAFSARQVFVFLDKLMQAYAAEELAINKLNTALSRNSVNLQKYASQLQKVTVYGDDVTMNAMAMVAAFTKDEDKIKAITKASMDFASVYKIDLDTAINLVTKSVFSTTNALSRYGIEVVGAQGSTERFESAITSITEKFGGQAEAERNTYVGSLKAANNELDDLYEKLGKNLTQGAGGFLSLTIPVLETFNYHAERGNKLLESLFKAFNGDLSIKEWLAQWVGIKKPLSNMSAQLKADRLQLEGLINKEFDTEVKITETKKVQTEELQKQYEIWKSMTRPKGAGLAPLSDEAEKREALGYDIWKTSMRGGGRGGLYEPAEKLEEAQNPMSALVSLSNQMASNFQFAGHTFVGQLSQAIAMVDSISNMILTIASMFGGGGGFGIGGLLGLIGLEKGGRITNLGGNISYTKIPSFAMGGSYSTPAYSGPMGGGYPVMVHKNETLDVYNAGQTSRMEKMLGDIKNAIITSNVHLSKKGKGGGSIKINIGRREIASIVQEELNNFTKSGYNLGEF